MKFSLSASRKHRPRDIDLCLADSLQLFASLRDLNPEVFKWKELANSKSAALKKPFMDLDDPTVVRQLLLKGRNRTDIGRKVIDELGFSITLWNGDADEDNAATISVRNGCFGRYTSNHFRLSFCGFNDLERNDELARRLIDAARRVLNADWVMLNRDIDDPRERPYLDRAMFLSPRLPLLRRILLAIRERRAQREPVSKGVIYLRSVVTD